MSGNGDFDDETIYGKPVQVIAIDEQENTFSLNEENLNLILSRVPPKMKLSIVSVVGAFRTGKSFLLDFFLKYLRYPQNKMGEEAWNNLFTSKTKLDGNSNLNENNNNNIHPDNFNEKETNNGFSWKSGTERNTLGIWFWSIPFIRKLKSTGESVAVLIVDTQGIFDSRLTQMMATSIFGLSTLLSSHQIYNVQNRLQEDHLQHLALFTEYGRATLKIQGINDEEEKKNASLDAEIDKSKKEKNVSASPMKRKEEEEDKKKTTDGDDNKEKNLQAPFQTLQFLIRDFQFETKEQREESGMKKYLDKFLSVEDRQQADLTEIREHIQESFEKVGIFLLPHPGFAVPEPDYDGDISKIRDVFRDLLRKYVPTVLERDLKPKTINGNYVTKSEFKYFVHAYTSIFGNSLPQCQTLFATTAEVNNRCAKELAYETYSAELDRMCGPGKRHVNKSKLIAHHEVCKEAAVSLFSARANLGNESSIQKFKDELTEQIEKKYQDALIINADRDPMKNLEMYLFPLVITFASYIISTVGNIFCIKQKTPEFDFEYADFCRGTLDLVNLIYGSTFFFLLIIVGITGRQAYQRIQLLLNPGGREENFGNKLKTD